MIALWRDKNVANKTFYSDKLRGLIVRQWMCQMKEIQRHIGQIIIKIYGISGFDTTRLS